MSLCMFQRRRTFKILRNLGEVLAPWEVLVPLGSPPQRPASRPQGTPRRPPGDPLPIFGPPGGREGGFLKVSGRFLKVSRRFYIWKRSQNLSKLGPKIGPNPWNSMEIHGQPGVSPGEPHDASALWELIQKGLSDPGPPPRAFGMWRELKYWNPPQIGATKFRGVRRKK